MSIRRIKPDALPSIHDVLDPIKKLTCNVCFKPLVDAPVGSWRVTVADDGMVWIEGHCLRCESSARATSVGSSASN